jgi:hypothetical protein
MDVIDDKLFEFMSIVELNNEVCHLKHTPSSNDEEYLAVNYLCQTMGFDDDIDSQIRIPICEECSYALCGKEWLLFYCIGCNSSQWLLKSKARRYYDPDTSVMWLKSCPNCYTVSL